MFQPNSYFLREKKQEHSTWGSKLGYIHQPSASEALAQIINGVYRDGQTGVVSVLREVDFCDPSRCKPNCIGKVGLISCCGLFLFIFFFFFDRNYLGSEA